MREYIARWGKRLEALVVAERGAARFKDVMRRNEFINVAGHDASILEVVLERGAEPYRINVYTRVVWSERNPSERPFAFKRYAYAPDAEEYPDADIEKPKQAFYDDQDFAPEYLTVQEAEERLGLS